MPLKHRRSRILIFKGLVLKTPASFIKNFCVFLLKDVVRPEQERRQGIIRTTDFAGHCLENFSNLLTFNGR